MATVEDVVRIAEGCAFNKRLPARSEDLAQQYATLTKAQRRRARARMAKLEVPERMARRAAQIAAFNPRGAARIVESMSKIFGVRRTADLIEQCRPGLVISFDGETSSNRTASYAFV